MGSESSSGNDAQFLKRPGHFSLGKVITRRRALQPPPHPLPPRGGWMDGWLDGLGGGGHPNQKSNRRIRRLRGLREAVPLGSGRRAIKALA